MVIKHKSSVWVKTSLLAISGLFFVASVIVSHVFATNPSELTFQVNVQEALTVSITTPKTTEWASGNAGVFLRNTVTLSVASNDSTGFTATMYAADTSLKNTSSSSITIPTLDSSATRGGFADNKWGYSLDVAASATGDDKLNNNVYGENDAGNDDSYYYPLTTSASPASVLVGRGTAYGTRNIYFGAKSTMSQASGTYTGTVVISVITGVVNNNPDGNTSTPEPSNPATPDVTEEEAYYNEAPTGDATSGSTTYTYTTNPTGLTTTTTTTEVSKGNNTSSYEGYTPPQGVTTIHEGTPLATGLAVTSAVAATTGIVFFIIAKRREDEEDEDEY